MTDTFAISNGYITLPITVDPNALIQQGIAAIQAQLPGWIPAEGHIEMILLEQFAAATAQTANVAASASQAIFEYFGQLVNILPISGNPSTAETTWTMTDTAGYTVPSGTVVGYQILGNQIVLFSTTEPFTINPGSQTATNILIQSQTVGTSNNNLTTGLLALVTSLSYVASVEAITISSGGANPETVSQYINRLSEELQLLTPRPILPGDYAVLAASVPGVTRATAYNNTFGGVTFTGNLTSGSNNVTVGPPTTIASPSNGVSLPQPVINVASTTSFPTSGTLYVRTDAGVQTVTYAGITSTTFTGCVGGAGVMSTGNAVLGAVAFNFLPGYVGLAITGAGIPAATTLTQWAAPWGMQMSHNATSNETLEVITLPFQGPVERSVAVSALDASGNGVSTAIQTAIISKLSSLREINFLVSYIQPGQLNLYVNYVVITDPGYDPNSVVAAVDAALFAYLSPANWAGGSATPPFWDTSIVAVKYLSLASVIDNVTGVQAIQTVTGTPSLGIGITPNPAYGYEDIALDILTDGGVAQPNLVAVSGSAIVGA